MKMKIIITVEDFDPDKGYLEYCLTKELAQLGHKVYVFTFGRGEQLSRTTSNEGFEVVKIPYFDSVHCYHVPSFSGIAYIFKFMKVERPNIIHCQPMYSPLSLFFVAWKRFFKYKIVGSLMTQLNLVYSSWDLKKKILFSFSKMVVKTFVEKRSELVFAKTGQLAGLLSQSYNVPRNKFRIIPLGSDPELFKFDSETRVLLRKKLGLSETDVVIVYSGKIYPSKGLDVLVRALAPITIINENVKLLIIGKGDPSFIKYLKTLISKLKIKSKVIFYPWVNSAALPSFYSASDIGVWPGLSSISIVDAASTGLPLIIARCPVETFTIENGNGFTFEIGNVEELRRCLEILIYDDKLRKEMGHKSRLLVEQKLNWKAITMQYLNAYNYALKL